MRPRRQIVPLAVGHITTVQCGWLGRSLCELAYMEHVTRFVRCSAAGLSRRQGRTRWHPGSLRQRDEAVTRPAFSRRCDGNVAAASHGRRETAATLLSSPQQRATRASQRRWCVPSCVRSATSMRSHYVRPWSTRDGNHEVTGCAGRRVGVRRARPRTAGITSTTAGRIAQDATSNHSGVHVRLSRPDRVMAVGCIPASGWGSASAPLRRRLPLHGLNPCVGGFHPSSSRNRSLIRAGRRRRTLVIRGIGLHKVGCR